MQLRHGYIACSIVTTGPDYMDQQLQQWGWTNSPPIQITPSFQIFNATWSVTGAGTKTTTTTATSPTGIVTTTTVSSAWTENGSLPISLKVRIDSSNRVVIAPNIPVSVPDGLNGKAVTRENGVFKGEQAIMSFVEGLVLPTVQWNGPLAVDRVAEGSLDPAAVVTPPPSPRDLIGSRLGQKVFGSTARSYAGSQALPNPQIGRLYQVPTAGSMSTANWSWRIYY